MHSWAFTSARKVEKKHKTLRSAVISNLFTGLPSLTTLNFLLLSFFAHSTSLNAAVLLHALKSYVNIYIHTHLCNHSCVFSYSTALLKLNAYLSEIPFLFTLQLQLQHRIFISITFIKFKKKKMSSPYSVLLFDTTNTFSVWKTTENRTQRTREWFVWSCELLVCLLRFVGWLVGWLNAVSAWSSRAEAAPLTSPLTGGSVSSTISHRHHHRFLHCQHRHTPLTLTLPANSSGLYERRSTRSGLLLSQLRKNRLQMHFSYTGGSARWCNEFQNVWRDSQTWSGAFENKMLPFNQIKLLLT